MSDFSINISNNQEQSTGLLALKGTKDEYERKIKRRKEDRRKERMEKKRKKLEVLSTGSDGLLVSPWRL